MTEEAKQFRPHGSITGLITPVLPPRTGYLPGSNADELLRRLTERNRRTDANALTVTALDQIIARFEPPTNEGEEITYSDLAP